MLCRFNCVHETEMYSTNKLQIAANEGRFINIIYSRPLISGITVKPG